MSTENNLRMYREALGFTQSEVAESIGVARETYNRMENGEGMPNLVRADKLAHKFGTTIYNLWPCLLSVEDFSNVIAAHREDERDRVRMSIIQTSDVFLRD